MRVALDLDNTTVEWQYHWADLYVEWFDREVDQTRLGEWDACVNATHFETHADFFEWFSRADGWATQPYVPGARSGMDWMQRAGVPFFFLTARPFEGEAAARKLGKDWNTITHFSNATSKQLAKADLWIDDSAEVLGHLADAGKTAIRLERPWNEGAPATFSAATWPEIIEILKELQ